MQIRFLPSIAAVVALAPWPLMAAAAPSCPAVENFLEGKALGVVCFHSDDLRTNNAVTTPANNSITTFADGTTLPGVSVLGFPPNFGAFTPVTDRGVISTGPAPSS